MSANDTSRNDCASLAEGNIRLYDNHVPTLPAGDYVINVTQRINPLNAGIDETHTASQVFSVQGPRYALPSGDVHSIFPPNNAEGVFNQFLPHVVLGKRELPWERVMFTDEDPTARTPWLALLLFVEGERIDGAEALLAPTVPDWKANRTMTATIPARDFHHHASGDGTLWPALSAEWFESEEMLKQTSATIIDISPQAFRALVPGRADLRYLSHVRRVDQTAKESGILKINGEGWYSIVVGNRLPDAPPPGSRQPGKRNILHLVSLEGFEEYVGGTRQIPAGTTRVRMISLKSWSFTCLPQMGESFAQAMNGLLKDARGNARPTLFGLQVPPPRDPSPEETFAYDAIRNGYVPLRYHTRLGEQSFGWYRGPFSPTPVKNFVAGKQQTSESPAVWKQFNTASAAMIYDPEHGLFDTSYGVAWETGRMMALSDPQFGPKLRNWQQKGHYLVDMIMERRQQMAAMRRNAPNGAPGPTLQAGAEQMVEMTEPYAVTDDLMVDLITDFSTRIAPKLYGRPMPRAAGTPDANGSGGMDATTDVDAITDADAVSDEASEMAGDVVSLLSDGEHQPVPFADLDLPAPTPGELMMLLGEEPSEENGMDEGGNDDDNERAGDGESAPEPRPLGADTPTVAAAVRAAVRSQGTDEMDDLVSWLSRLYLLTGVPFECLVPHAGMLSEESVRFFYVDSNWLDILVEGALSIGIESSRDVFYQKLMRDLVRKGTVAEARSERRMLLGSSARPEAPNAPPFDQETITGLLLRSSVVSGWPGLEIHAYARTRPGSAEPDLSTHIDLLRMERLSSDVMLCLWPAVPAVVTIDEPHEGVAFGFQDPPKEAGNGYWLYLRSLDKTSYGKPLPEQTYNIDAASGIIGADRRIRITGAGGLLEAMRSRLPGSPEINVRDFAVQMIKVPETAIFAAPPTGQENA